MRVECARTMTQGLVSYYFLPITLHPHLWTNPKFFSSALPKVLSSSSSQVALKMESGGKNATTGSPRDQMTFQSSSEWIRGVGLLHSHVNQSWMLKAQGGRGIPPWPKWLSSLEAISEMGSQLQQLGE